MGSVRWIGGGTPPGLRRALVLGVLVLLCLTGCHTTSGFGQDVQSLGRDIQKNAK
jgi:predicted small secreted protein